MIVVRKSTLQRPQNWKHNWSTIIPCKDMMDLSLKNHYFVTIFSNKMPTFSNSEPSYLCTGLSYFNCVSGFEVLVGCAFLNNHYYFFHLTPGNPVWDYFTLPNARRFYLSMGKVLGLLGLKCMWSVNFNCHVQKIFENCDVTSVTDFLFRASLEIIKVQFFATTYLHTPILENISFY